MNYHRQAEKQMAMRNENSTSATTPPVASSCPVNHEARAVWLRKSNIDSSNNDSHNKINQKSDRPSSSSPSQPSSSSSSPSSAPLPQSYLSQPCDSSTIDQTTSTTATANPASTTRFTTTSTTSTTQSSNPLIPAILSSFPFNRQHRQAAAAAPTEQELDTERQVSSIPRVSLNTPGSSEDSGVVNNDGRARDTSANSVGNSTTTRTAPAAPAAAPAAAGNWIYPSERMFFDAMRRKSYDPKAEDMRAIVPIHNAVNEKAWKEIRKWEMGKGADKYVYFFINFLFFSFSLSHALIFAIHHCWKFLIPKFFTQLQPMF